MDVVAEVLVLLVGVVLVLVELEVVVELVELLLLVDDDELDVDVLDDEELVLGGALWQSRAASWPTVEAP